MIKHRIDVMHSYSFYGNVFGILPAKLASTPVVIASTQLLRGERAAGEQRGQDARPGGLAEQRAHRRQHVGVTHHLHPRA